MHAACPSSLLLFRRTACPSSLLLFRRALCSCSSQQLSPRWLQLSEQGGPPDFCDHSDLLPPAMHSCCSSGRNKVPCRCLSHSSTLRESSSTLTGSLDRRILTGFLDRILSGSLDRILTGSPGWEAHRSIALQHHLELLYLATHTPTCESSLHVSLGERSFHSSPC